MKRMRSIVFATALLLFCACLPACGPHEATGTAPGGSTLPDGSTGSSASIPVTEPPSPAAQEIRIDATGGEQIKSLLGINNGPCSGYDLFDTPYIDATALFADMGISMVRLHDAEFPFGRDAYIDIHCIFPDFSADADDPSAYDFSGSDAYVAAVAATGAEVLFRLGESIDSLGVPGVRYIGPPADFDKWADVCVQIVRHYREDLGYDIRYWEIWNEPDMATMWTGTIEQYYDLYYITATKLKAAFPEIMVGGPALATTNRDTVQQFLAGITRSGVRAPLDFFTWHCYASNPRTAAAQAKEIKNTLTSAGLGDIPLWLDEWNYVANWNDLSSTYLAIKGMQGASYAAATMICLQDSPADAAFYYDGQSSDYWCGLYGKPYFGIMQDNMQALAQAWISGGADAFRTVLKGLLAPYADGDLALYPAYHTMCFWSDLCRKGERVGVRGDGQGVYVLAARDGDALGVLATNYTKEEKTVAFAVEGGAYAAVTVTTVREDGTTETEVFVAGDDPLRMSLAPYAVVYLEFTK